MTWQELLLYAPAVAFIAGAWIVAWRVSKTGNVAARNAVQAPQAPTSARGDALANH